MSFQSTFVFFFMWRAYNLVIIFSLTLNSKLFEVDMLNLQPFYKRMQSFNNPGLPFNLTSFQII